MSDARVQQSRLAHVLVHDELTGLPNRAAFPAQFRSAISRAAERGQAVAVLSLALDGQALVNETLGQFARDALVHAAAARLKACLFGRRRPGPPCGKRIRPDSAQRQRKISWPCASASRKPWPRLSNCPASACS
ncbi:diguanylate cyclase [Massilia sp. H-1]|nr:diguanylate cyclase [Massilia sp. H-1]